MATRRCSGSSSTGSTRASAGSSRSALPSSTRETANPLTCGARFDTEGLTEALVAAAGDVRLGEPLRELPRDTPVVLATGGFQGDRELVRTHVTPEADHLLLRANPWSAGDGLRLGLAAGGKTSAGMNEFYGRNMPAPPARVTEADFVRAGAALRAPRDGVRR